MLLLLILVGCQVTLGQDQLWIVPPTRGRPWPLPHSEHNSIQRMTINPNIFKFQSTNFDCDILQQAYERYKKWTFPAHPSGHWSSNEIPSYDPSTLFTLEMNLLARCESLPYLDMDEQYQLKICAPDAPTKATLISNSVWGALRGLETFSQLVVPTNHSSLYEINCTQIMDFPRFSHRGLMLDTSRHFLPLVTLKENLDLMAMNKFNVFHWHIVDDQSFPYVSGVFPKLSAKGAWSKIHHYSQSDISEIIEYARIRGIRVIVEFDTPGHTYSWGLGQPGLLTKCYDSDGLPNGNLGPIDPSREENFDFLANLFTEVADRFPDHYLHLGGDEVPFECWKSNPDINNLMAKLNITGNYAKLEEYYFSRLLDFISNLPSNNGYMVWQEVFDNGLEIAKDTVVHVWKYGADPSQYYDELKNVTKAGHQAILSSCWYLNYIHYGSDWHNHYQCDPLGFNGTDSEKRLVIGGEACMWGEYVDKTNIIPRTWPRASAVAERLWSPAEKTQTFQDAGPRLEEHRCRLLRRGHAVEPLGPSYCEGIL